MQLKESLTNVPQSGQHFTTSIVFKVNKLHNCSIGVSTIDQGELQIPTISSCHLVIMEHTSEQSLDLMIEFPRLY